MGVCRGVPCTELSAGGVSGRDRLPWPSALPLALLLCALRLPYCTTVAMSIYVITAEPSQPWMVQGQHETHSRPGTNEVWLLPPPEAGFTNAAFWVSSMLTR